MIIKNRTIVKEGFIEALTKLMNVEMPAKQCLEVSRSIEELIGQLNIILRAQKSIANKYCLKDVDGNPICNEKGEITFESEEIKNKYIKEMTEILDEEIDISLSSKIKIKGDTKLTPLIYKLLEDIIEVV